jgi:hypothetical protein
MARPPKARVEKTRTVHMYAELWHASASVLDAGWREQRGSSWEFLSSLILTAFSFEAYLNHAGDSLISCWGRLRTATTFGKIQSALRNPEAKFSKGQDCTTASNDK